MTNDNAQMAQFAKNIWENYMSPMVKKSEADTVKYYRAEVVTNDGSNLLTIKRPYDNSYQVACTKDMSDVTAGTQVIVIRFGNGTNNSNHLVVAKGDGNPAVTATDAVSTLSNLEAILAEI